MRLGGSFVCDPVAEVISADSERTDGESPPAPPSDTERCRQQLASKALPGSRPTKRLQARGSTDAGEVSPAPPPVPAEARVKAAAASKAVAALRRVATQELDAIAAGLQLQERCPRRTSNPKPCENTSSPSRSGALIELGMSVTADL